MGYVSLLPAMCATTFVFSQQVRKALLAQFFAHAHALNSAEAGDCQAIHDRSQQCLSTWKSALSWVANPRSVRKHRLARFGSAHLSHDFATKILYAPSAVVSYINVAELAQNLRLGFGISAK
jgi:hypothetical protein